MFNKIDVMLEERFSSEEGCLRPYDENGVYVATAIEDLFEAEGFEEGDYSVESDVVFPSAVDVAYISVAFINCGKLHHTVYVID